MNVIQIFNSESVQNVIAKAQQEISQAIGFDVIIEVYPKEESEPTMKADDIIQTFCAVWGIHPEKIKRKNRKQDYVAMRQILAMRLKMIKLTLSDIGKKLGDRDHTSIIHSLQSAKDRLECQDGLFMYYFTPVQHLFNMSIKKAIA